MAGWSWQGGSREDDAGTAAAKSQSLKHSKDVPWPGGAGAQL